MFSALLSAAVFLWAVMALPETRRFASVRGRGAASSAPTSRRSRASPRFFGYALVRRVRLGAVLQLPRRRAARRRHHAGAHVRPNTGLWFFLPSIGFMAGNFTGVAADGALRHRRADLVGHRPHLVGCLLNAGRLRSPFRAGRWSRSSFRRSSIGLGNGLLLPTAIAGAMSIRPQVAGTASGMIGFIQMAIGAAAAQFSGHVIARATSAMPMIC